MSRFTYACPLRWADQDAYGHVNNVQFLRYLEEARIAVFLDGARAAGVDDFVGTLVVVRHEINYRRPLRYRPEPVTIDLWVSEIRTSSASVDYQVRDEDHTYADARTVFAALDPETHESRPLTGAERAWLEKYTEA